MCGNVSEWTDSWYSDSYRIALGGYYNDLQNYNSLKTWEPDPNHPSYSGYEFGFRCAISIVNTSGECETVTDIDGNVYEIIQLGDQCWLAENLKVTHYRNGDPILYIVNDSEWINTIDGAHCVYDNNGTYFENYGYLYNWFAVDDPRGLAPEGWHVPTDEEIMELEMYLGMSEEDANWDGWRGTNEGSKLAGRADLWLDGDLENDPEFGTSGFDLLPGGYRDAYGSGYFDAINYWGYIWTSTEYYGYDNDDAWVRALNKTRIQINRDNLRKECGFSIRCIKD